MQTNSVAISITQCGVPGPRITTCHLGECPYNAMNLLLKTKGLPFNQNFPSFSARFVSIRNGCICCRLSFRLPKFLQPGHTNWEMKATIILIYCQRSFSVSFLSLFLQVWLLFESAFAMLLDFLTEKLDLQL